MQCHLVAFQSNSDVERQAMDRPADVDRPVTKPPWHVSTRMQLCRKQTVLQNIVGLVRHTCCETGLELGYYVFGILAVVVVAVVDVA